MLCASDAKWDVLVDVIGRSDLKGDKRYSTLKERVAHIDEVDELVSRFTRGLSKQEAFSRLMTAGITCAPVRDLDEVVNDVHMRERGALELVHHPIYGDMVLPRSPLRFSEAPLPVIEPSGDVGRDNAAIYCDWLGKSHGEFERLESDGVI